MMIKIKNIIVTVASFLLILNMAFITDVYAVERLDKNVLSDLTVHFEYDGTKISGAEFSIYKVADTEDYISFNLTDAFSAYPINLDNNDSDSWTRLGTTLKGYVLRDGIAERSTNTTSSSGELTFSNLEPGIYLVIGNDFRTSKYSYTILPFVIAIPGIEENHWNNHVFAEVKCSRKDNSNGKNDYISIKVIKEWKDNGYEDNRPEYIEVQLLKNKDVYRTEKLSEENNWTITWKNLDEKYEWTVVEKDVPDNYTVTVTQEGNINTITNTYSSIDNPPDNPPENPQNNPPDNPGDNINTEKPPINTTEKKTNLPKTGDDFRADVWISLLVAALAVMIGVIIKNIRRRKH